MQVPESVLPIGINKIPETLLIERLIARGMSTSVTFGWEAEQECSLENLMLDHQIYREHSANGWLRGALVIETDEVVACVNVIGPQVFGQVAGDETAASRFVEAVKSVLRPVEPDDSKVEFNFWHASDNGPRGQRRMLEIEPWESISDNYPTVVRAQLDELMEWREPPGRGQLLLWQGRPGTGKTTALRALASEWREWCSFHLVLDPEKLFSKAEYLYDVALTRDSSAEWRLLVLEDTGELLASDARAQTGQSLSRLLNLVDGIIGQGMNTMVLVTTNEELGSLHPAVTRSGRCASQIEFRSFPEDEAATWFADRDLTVPERPPRVLAEMFATLDGVPTRHLEPAFGFRN